MEALVDRQKLAVWRIIDEGFNQGSYQVVPELCAEDFLDATSIFSVPAGPDGLVHHMRNARERIPGFSLRVVSVLGEGEVVAVVWQTVGAAGGYFGSAVPWATSAWLIAFLTFRDGRIVLKEDNFESVRLLAQGGALPLRTEGDDDPVTPKLGLIANLLTPRTEQYDRYPDRDEAVAPDPASPARREQVVAAVTGMLRHAYGLAERPPVPIAADAHLSWSPDTPGPDGLAEHRAHMVTAFEASEPEVRHLVVERDRAAVRFTLTLHHRGPFLGLPPTGRTVRTSGAAYARFDGQTLVEWIEVVDLLSLLRELGGLSVLLPGCLPSQ